MNYKLLLLLVILSAQLVLGGCSYQVKPDSVSAIDIRNDYGDKIKGHAKLNIDSSFKGISKKIKPKSYVCSAHDYPVDLGDNLYDSVNDTIVQIFESVGGSEQLSKQLQSASVDIDLEKFDPSVSFIMGFWTSTAEAKTDLRIRVKVAKDGVTILDKRVAANEEADGDGGGSCEGGPNVIAESIEKTVQSAMEKLAEAVVNSDQVRVAFGMPVRQLYHPQQFVQQKEKNPVYKDDLTDFISGMDQSETDSNKYLLAISISDYEEAPDVPFAEHSGELVTQVIGKKFGVPDENIYELTGSKATGTRIRRTLNNISERLDEDDTLYFYYSGHGIPAKTGDNLYLLPSDGGADFFEDDSLEINEIYNRLGGTKAKKVVGFVDACFSGRADDDQLIFDGVAAIKVVRKQEVNSDKMTVFVAGGRDDFSNQYKEKNNRLFSYYLIRGIIDGKENSDDLYKYVRDNVYKRSKKLGANYTQEPEILGNIGVSIR